MDIERRLADTIPFSVPLGERLIKWAELKEQDEGAADQQREDLVEVFKAARLVRLNPDVHFSAGYSYKMCEGSGHPCVRPLPAIGAEHEGLRCIDTRTGAQVRTEGSTTVKRVSARESLEEAHSEDCCNEGRAREIHTWFDSMYMLNARHYANAKTLFSLFLRIP